MNRGTRDTICATIGLLIVIALLTTVAALDSPGEMDEPNALSSAAPEPRVEMPEDSLPAEEYAYCNDVCLGLFELTAYCPCSACCGKNDGITAKRPFSDKWFFQQQSPPLHYGCYSLLRPTPFDPRTLSAP